MDKAEIRKQYVNIRNNITNRNQKESEILRNLFPFLDNSIIMSYMSIKSEVSTKDINSHIKNLVLPLVSGDILIPKLVLNIETDTKLGAFNIIEPLQNLQTAQHIDIVLVPAVCFSRDKNRIGYGKGFYDKFLEHREIFKIGICFDEQITDEIFADEFDVPMDIIVTDKAIYR